MLAITQLDAVPSIGALLGSRGSQELLSSINKSLGANSFFGSSDDRYGNQHRSFMTKFVEPIRKANSMISSIGARLVQQDYIRPLTNSDDLKNCPPVMMPALLTFEPLYKLFKQGRVSGWGYTPEALVDAKEQYTRLIETNGTVNYEVDSPQYDKENKVFVEETTIWYGIDPMISFEERCDIEETREYIEKLLKETDLDPTDITELRG